MRANNINGAIIGTTSSVKVGTINLSLSYEDTWALCNLLHKDQLSQCARYLDKNQIEILNKIGRDLGILTDHPSRDNIGNIQTITQKD